MLVEIKKYFGSLMGPDRRVKLHGRVCMETNPSEFFNSFKDAIEASKRGRNNLIIDLSNAEFVYPSSLIFLLSLSRTLRDDIGIEFEISKKGAVHEYLSFCGFKDHFNLPNFPEGIRPSFEPGQIIRLESGDHILNEEEKAEWFVSQVEQHVKLERHFKQLATDSIAELLRNVKQHSGSDKYYLLAQHYPKSKRVRFVIYDDGVGIKAHLIKVKYSKRHAMFQKLVSTKDFTKIRKSPANIAIEWASREMITGSDYSRNSGVGLHFLQNDFALPTESRVSILSSDGFVSWQSGEKKISMDLPYEIKGTLISITSSPLKPG